ncbi:hypothetical protein ACP4OV_010008 [Aristida adscensionis]
MASSSSTGAQCLLLAVILLSSAAAAAYAQLSTTFYASSCPNLEAIVSNGVTSYLNTDKRMGASFSSGCDASILLVNNATFTGEQGAAPNANSVRGYNVINDIKAQVETACPGVVSCADIVALAAREGTAQLGGPSWAVPLGRRDSTTASLTQANNDLPAPTSSLSTLISKFAAKGLSATDMTALSGAHSIGMAQCQNFRDRIYKDKNIDPPFANSFKTSCTRTGGAADVPALAALDVQTSVAFDNAYYANLVQRKGLLHSDQELFNGGSQDALVQQYSSNPAQFASDFVTAMIKMGNVGVLTGSAGQIRTDCGVVS